MGIITKITLLSPLISSCLALPYIRASNSSYPSLPPTGITTLKPFSLATDNDAFVTARNGKLYLNGVDYTFAAFNNVRGLTPQS
jgi:hypothetical protein